MFPASLNVVPSCDVLFNRIWEKGSFYIPITLSAAFGTNFLCHSGYLRQGTGLWHENCISRVQCTIDQKAVENGAYQIKFRHEQRTGSRPGSGGTMPYGISAGGNYSYSRTKGTARYLNSKSSSSPHRCRRKTESLLKPLVNGSSFLHYIILSLLKPDAPNLY